MRRETLEFAKKFEKAWERLREEKGYNGSPEELFLEILERAKGKSFLEGLANKLGVSTTFLIEFLERFFETILCRGEKKLGEFLEEVENGNWVLVDEKILKEFEEKNKKRILEFKKFAKLDYYSAKVGLFNLLLERVPKELELWERFEKLRKEKNLDKEDFFYNLLSEEEARLKEDVELIPVSGKNWKKLVELFQKLPSDSREALFRKLRERMNRAISSTICDVLRIIKQEGKKREKTL